MNGAQLKNSILQWAIQGKLVPQNPKDEPAQKLLERIAASRNVGDSRHSERSEESSKGSKKASLRGAKATKQSKALSSRIYRENGVWYEQIGTATPKDITDEIPFEIPESWEWVRLPMVGELNRGKSQARPRNDPSLFSNGTFPMIQTGDVARAETVISSCKSKYNEKGIAQSRIWPKGTICLTIAANIGDVAILGFDACFPDSVVGFNAYTPIDSNLFFLYALKCYKNILDELSRSTAQKNINIDILSKIFFPLPPLAEQKRIVAKLEQVLPLAEEYGAAQEQLDKLNKELPEALKKSILQEAIQGKLVPQNPKDEPAQKLLESIAASRNESSLSLPKGTSSTSLRGPCKGTKQSKNPPSRIYHENGVWYEQIGTATPKDISDEIPFDIPASWVWCRLGQCSDYGATKEKAKSFDGIKDSWSLDLEDIEKNSGRIVKRLKVCERKIVGEKVVFRKGQVLYSKLRPYLKKILVAPEDGVCSSEIVPFSPFENLDPNYLVIVLKSPHVDYTINLVTYGVKMPRVGTDTMLNLLIPIPPLAEQKRIVTKLEQLFKVL